MQHSSCAARHRVLNNSRPAWTAHSQALCSATNGLLKGSTGGKSLSHWAVAQRKLRATERHCSASSERNRDGCTRAHSSSNSLSSALVKRASRLRERCARRANLANHSRSTSRNNFRLSSATDVSFATSKLARELSQPTPLDQFYLASDQSAQTRQIRESINCIGRSIYVNKQQQTKIDEPPS